MGRVVQARQLRDSLSKVQSVARLEESFDIDGTVVVLTSPSVRDILRIAQTINGLSEDEEFSAEEQQYELIMSQLGYAVAEIGDLNLRDVDVIEDEAPAGTFVLEVLAPTQAAATKAVEVLQKLQLKATVTPPDQVKSVRLEKVEWLRRNVFAGWGDAALTVAYQALSSLMRRAEERARANVKLAPINQTREEEIRQHIISAFEKMDSLPVELAMKILDDFGLQRATSKREADAALSDLAKIEPKAEKKEEAAPEPEPEPPPPQPQQRIQEATVQMQRRVPLNQQVPEDEPAPVRKRPEVPDEIKRAAKANTQSLSRAQQIAELEAGALDENLQVPVLTKVSPGFDPALVQKAVDPPVKAGINPRFRRV